MYLHLFLLLFSSGASSSFLPLKESPGLQNKTRYAIIEEMLCLLKAQGEPVKGQFLKPLHIKNLHCAHFNTKNFIHELRKVTTCRCMKRVEKDMERLQEKCPLLKKSSSHDKICSEMATNFSQFKESLEEFLKWVNQKQSCSNIMRSDLDSSLDNKCSCPDSWKSSRGCF